eukprot:4110824-Alexandrium_andersonii.AAC.1
MAQHALAGPFAQADGHMCHASGGNANAQGLAPSNNQHGCNMECAATLKAPATLEFEQSCPRALTPMPAEMMHLTQQSGCAQAL